MRTYIGKLMRMSLFVIISSVLVFGSGTWGGYSAQAAVNGSLRQVGSQQILSLWGSYNEMGYAHGYLMADKIRDLVDTYVVGVIAKGDVADYNSHLSLIPVYHTFYPEYLDEINGMVAGMIASGKNLYVPSLNRNIDDRDIKAFNLFIQYSFGCSSFGVWGSSTGNGETIMARNYDFDYDSQGNILNNQILITYEPTGKPKIVSLAWPGWYGVTTGMNEYGISTMVNAGNAENSSSTGPFYPSVEVYRKILESTTLSNYATKPLSIVNSVSEYIPMIIKIGAPYLNSGDPVYYIEDSSSSNVVRKAADTNPTYNHIIATNHFMKISSPPSSGDTVDRYNSLKNGLINLYGTGDHKVDSLEAWSLLDSVADIVAPTLTSIVVRPNRMEFDVSFATKVNGVFKSATKIQPQTYTWASLFPGESLPDLIVQSIVTSPAAPKTGQSMTATITLKNQGSADSGGFTLEFYKNLAAAPASQQFGDDYCVKNELAAGATSSCTFTVVYSSAGSYNMWAQVDTGRQVTELNETNNISGPKATLVTVTDTTLPVNSITAPVTGSTVSGTVSIAASASDNVGVVKVEFYVNGSLKGTDTTVPYSYSWDSKSVANGSYSLTAKAYDAAGNVNQSAAISVTVKNSVADATAPTVSVTSPVANSTVSGTVCAAVSVSDNVGVTKVEYYVNGGLDKAVLKAPFGYCVVTTKTYNGTYSMYAKAYDAAGNTKQSSSIKYTILNR